MKIKIENDVFDIANRIKQIDRDYCIFFNTSTNQFEVHNISQPNNSFCLSVPYHNLDERALKLTRETNSANIEIILSQIDNENSIKENAEYRNILNKFNDQLEQIIKENKWK